ncbi:MAG: glucose-6-phosphate 1-dehydrogenase, partial [bacterium]
MTLSTNPLREGLPRERMPEPATLVIFGATGDLTRRKLIPALYRLFRQRQLPPGFRVVGVGRTEMNDPDFAALALLAIAPAGREGGDEFAALFRYVTGDFSDPGT